MSLQVDQLSPKQLVEFLDEYIIGQEKAKKFVAIALRNRYRRKKIPDLQLQEEIYPKNILMIGSTGVGKTEISRRLSQLTGAPFLKVEATKYTEVGYVGRDVESMVRDLLNVAIGMVKKELKENVIQKAQENVRQQLLELLENNGIEENDSKDKEDALEKTLVLDQTQLAKKLDEGLLDEKEIEIFVKQKVNFPSVGVLSNANIDEINEGLNSLGNLLGHGQKARKMSVKEARKFLIDEELEKIIDFDKVVEIAKERTEQMGMIFIDEIDKIASKEGHSTDVSREGVQRDILPIIEGSQVSTKHGVIDTKHILFIAAGAFHMSKPSDLIPELQGRFPLVVELKDLTEEDFARILTQPKHSLISQYQALMSIDNIKLQFNPEGVKAIARSAKQLNTYFENLGARRLGHLLEILLEDISFEGHQKKEKTIVINKKYVQEKLEHLFKKQDLNKFIL